MTTSAEHPAGSALVAVTGASTGMGAATARELARAMTDEQHRRYDDLIVAVVEQSVTFTRDGVSAAAAARTLADAATAARPRTRYTVGRDAAVLVRLARVVPDRLLDRIVARGLRPAASTS